MFIFLVTVMLEMLLWWFWYLAHPIQGCWDAFAFVYYIWRRQEINNLNWISISAIVPIKLATTLTSSCSRLAGSPFVLWSNARVCFCLLCISISRSPVGRTTARLHAVKERVCSRFVGQVWCRFGATLHCLVYDRSSFFGDRPININI